VSKSVVNRIWKKTRRYLAFTTAFRYYSAEQRTRRTGPSKSVCGLKWMRKINIIIMANWGLPLKTALWRVERRREKEAGCARTMAATCIGRTNAFNVLGMPAVAWVSLSGNTFKPIAIRGFAGELREYCKFINMFVCRR